ncbi:MAG: glycosyltransferase family 39 protein [Nostoc sp. DedVER02]|uniref:glycosyltransferase family 39 protein n=1 Tax=unclassified Nostoc TaxID=2593658 RepID=UPI002AD40E0A|nr:MULTISPECIES: glycosyltransferase family 39 protein [unclassified Nostoc]MDZ7985796.1 glycosyltransferase family 39 protein [Nostoc sp. DedVER02]MDZ8114631.1 glycosyltransferase family 39 protein [Nostoc sp. DedVER01b]
MEKQSLQNWNISKSWLRFVIIILLVIGVFFRLANLDKKVYWGDEAFSSLRISGYLQAEMNDQLSDGRVFTIEDLHKYQYPNAEKNAGDTLKGIILEDSQILPLYIIVARFWVELFGDSIAVARSFSAFISLFTFPLLYLLCVELFESSLVGWMAIALIAVSPIHLVYAQEVRAYSLWIVTVLMSSVALLRAMRLKTKVSWGIYAVTISLGLYTHLFFALVAFGQGIYLMAMERFRLSKTSIYYLISSLAGVMSFVPWIWVIITNPQPEAVSWANDKQTLLESGMRWAGLFSRPFLDLGISPNAPGIVKIALIPFILIILSLIIYSIYFLCRRTPKKVWLFVLTLIGAVGIPLLIADFIFQKRYATSRYTLSSVLGIQLAIAYLLTTKMVSINTKAWKNKLWSLVTFLLITSGIVSCSLNSQAQMWWNKLPEKYEEFPKIANVVSQGNKPLLISTTANILPPVQVLSYLLDPKVQYQIIGKNQLPKIANGFSDIFLFLVEPSDSLKSGIEKVYNSKLQQIDQFLWKVTKST